MTQVPNSLIAFSRLLTTLLSPKPIILPSAPNHKGLSDRSEVLAHHHAIEQVRKVQANYQMQGWIR